MKYNIRIIHKCFFNFEISCFTVLPLNLIKLIIINMIEVQVIRLTRNKPISGSVNPCVISEPFNNKRNGLSRIAIKINPSALIFWIKPPRVEFKLIKINGSKIIKKNQIYEKIISAFNFVLVSIFMRFYIWGISFFIKFVLKQIEKTIFKQLVLCNSHKFY